MIEARTLRGDHRRGREIPRPPRDTVSPWRRCTGTMSNRRPLSDRRWETRPDRPAEWKAHLDLAARAERVGGQRRRTGRRSTDQSPRRDPAERSGESVPPSKRKNCTAPIVARPNSGAALQCCRAAIRWIRSRSTATPRGAVAALRPRARTARERVPRKRRLRPSGHHARAPPAPPP